MPTPNCRALIDKQLMAGNHEQDARAQIYSGHISRMAVSLWLETSTESAIIVLLENFDRVIERAYRSIYEDKVRIRRGLCLEWMILHC
jgi:hypothetical protein